MLAPMAEAEAVSSASDPVANGMGAYKSHIIHNIYVNFARNACVCLCLSGLSIHFDVIRYFF